MNWKGLLLHYSIINFY